MKRFIAVCIILLSMCVAIDAEEYDISGQWNIQGHGFAKRVIKVNADIDGYMMLYTATAAQISDDLRELISQGLMSEDILSGDVLSSDLRFLTGYDIHLELDLTRLNIGVWEQDIPNGMKIPAPLPEMRPSNSEPYRLIGVNIDNAEQNMNYSIILTSINSGVIKINGIIKNVQYAGNIEIDSDSYVWKFGTIRPSFAEDKSDSGCNSGLGIFALALVGVYGKYVRYGYRH